MRVLSIQQPYAQLVVRGVKRLEVRTWTTDFRGRIAIHASAAVPSHDIERESKTNRELGECFAEQGWENREDLKKLPRSAIIGTVELTGVHLGRDVHAQTTGQFAWNSFSDLLELATRDPLTGHLRPISTSVRPLPVTTPMDEYVWAFVRPVEIEPITEVTGKLNLWTMPEGLARQVAEGEARSMIGEWDPPPVDRAKRKKSMAAWRLLWTSVLERDVDRMEENFLLNRESGRLQFPDRDFEDAYLMAMLKYARERGVDILNEHNQSPIPVDAHIRRLFDGREAVPELEFDVAVRRYIRDEAARMREEKWVKERRPRLVAMLAVLRKEAEKRPSLAAEIDLTMFNAIRGLAEAQERNDDEYQLPTEKESDELDPDRLPDL
jgi:hypothetical protein